MLENMLEENDFNNLNNKVEEVNGRLDIAWRGKDNLTINKSNYWINTREHMDTDANIEIFYKLMWIAEADNAQTLIDQPENKTQDFSAYLIEADTQRLLKHCKTR